MKSLLIIIALTLPLGVFAQGNIVNAQMQAQNVNYYDNINDDNNPIQTNIANQQANPPAQEQSSGNSFGSEENNQTKTTGCKDCDAVKKALAAAHASSGARHHQRSFGMKRWAKTFAGRMDMKMKKVFAHRKKIRTSYEFCFNWH
jgi:hypothetical protein